MTNNSSGPLDYLIRSDRTWLSVFPNHGILAGGEDAEIAVSAVSAGVSPDTHRGQLTIMPAAQTAENTEVIADVAVTFVVTPTDGND